MFEHGQRKISLFCWFMPITWPVENHQWHHSIDSSGGMMWDQHQANVVGLINVIRETGFNELHFLFGAQGDKAMDSEWTVWPRAWNWAPARFSGFIVGACGGYTPKRTALTIAARSALFMAARGWVTCCVCSETATHACRIQAAIS